MFDNDNGDMFDKEDLELIQDALRFYAKGIFVENPDLTERCYAISGDIHAYLDSLLPEKYMRVHNAGGKVEFDEDNKSLHNGWWSTKIVYNPEYLEAFGYVGEAFTDEVFAERIWYYHPGDTHRDLKRIMDEAHNWHKDATDEEIESW